MTRIKRRDFLKSMTAVAAGGALPAPAIWSSAKAQARQETILAVTEYGPNNFDIHGVGTNRPGYEVSWNCYDRLMSHGEKTLPDGSKSYDRDKFTPELAEDWNATDTAVTFKLRKNVKFHDGTPITAKDVKWSFDRAVSVGGFPTFQMKAGSLEARAVRRRRRPHLPVDFIRKDKLTMPDLAVIVPAVYHLSSSRSKPPREKDP
jgi:peptide/nickel transport system substrate-binding protein